MTLKRASAGCADLGEAIPISTLARIEQGKLDPGVRRLHVLLRLYDVPPHLVADLVELEDLAVEPPTGSDLETLYRDGVRHWEDGNIGEGLAHLIAVREHAPEDDDGRLLRQRATLAFGIAARNLGKYRLAKQIVDDLLVEPPAPEIRARTLVLASSLWRHLGSIDAALGLIGQATTYLESADDKNVAYVLHQLASTQLAAGRVEDAERSVREAIAAYGRCDNVYGECRARLLTSTIAEARGDVASALTIVREVVDAATRHGHERLVASAHIDIGRLCLLAGSEEEGFEALREGLSRAVRLDDKHAEFMAHYHLWKAYAKRGDRERARFEFEAARYFVDSVDEASPEADEVRRARAQEETS